MAMQYACEVCHELENEMMLICIHGKLMCFCCVKQHIVDLESKIERLEKENQEIIRGIPDVSA